MSITATELKSNLEKSLMLAATEHIVDRADIAKSLFGILSADITLEETKSERLNQI